MGWRSGLAVVWLLWASVTSAHDPFKLDARRAEPGDIQLTLIEWPRAVAPAPIRYRLQAVGIPRGVLFGVFVKDFAHSFHEVVSGLQVDESGHLGSSAPRGVGPSQRQDAMVLE